MTFASLLDQVTLGISTFLVRDPLHTRSFLSLGIILFAPARIRALAYSFYSGRLLLACWRSSPEIIGAQLGLGGSLGLYSLLSLLSINTISLYFPSLFSGEEELPKTKTLEALDRENTVPKMEAWLNSMLESLGSTTRFDFQQWYGRWIFLLDDGEWFAFLGHRLSPEEQDALKKAVSKDSPPADDTGSWEDADE
ncbi:MAG: hypothetical protein SGCHY_001432 [Lobulomycetales sp.]